MLLHGGKRKTRKTERGVVFESLDRNRRKTRTTFPPEEESTSFLQSVYLFSLCDFNYYDKILYSSTIFVDHCCQLLSLLCMRR